jgi:hypothetical protein
MAVPCPVCARSFTSEAAIQAHTGTMDPALRKAHVCTCKQRFCSQRAFAQHRLSTSHPLPSCVICKKEFRSEKALADHKHAKHVSKPAGEVTLPSAPKMKKVSPINCTSKSRLPKHSFRNRQPKSSLVHPRCPRLQPIVEAMEEDTAIATPTKETTIAEMETWRCATATAGGVDGATMAEVDSDSDSDAAEPRYGRGSWRTDVI